MPVTLALVYGEDLQLSASGGLLLVDDSGPEATASIQRLTRIVLTTARQFDGTGLPISRGDDLFHPDFGAGLPAAVDENVTSGLLYDIKTAILQAIAIDPNFANAPAPTVVFSQPDTQTLNLVVTATTTSGKVAVTPPIPISIGG